MNKTKITEKVAKNVVNAGIQRNEHYRGKVISYFYLKCPGKGCERRMKQNLFTKRSSMLFASPIVVNDFRAKPDIEIIAEQIKVAILKKGWRKFDKEDGSGKYEILCDLCSSKRNTQNK